MAQSNQTQSKELQRIAEVFRQSPRLSVVALFAAYASEHPQIYVDGRSEFKLGSVSELTAASLTTISHWIGSPQLKTPITLEMIGVLTQTEHTYQGRQPWCPTLKALEIIRNASGLYQHLAKLAETQTAPYFVGLKHSLRDPNQLVRTDGTVKAHYVFDPRRAKTLDAYFKECYQTEDATLRLVTYLSERAQLLTDIGDRFEQMAANHPVPCGEASILNHGTAEFIQQTTDSELMPLWLAALSAFTVASSADDPTRLTAAEVSLMFGKKPFRVEKLMETAVLRQVSFNSNEFVPNNEAPETFRTSAQLYRIAASRLGKAKWKRRLDQDMWPSVHGRRLIKTINRNMQEADSQERLSELSVRFEGIASACDHFAKLTAGKDKPVDLSELRPPIQQDRRMVR